MYLTLFFDVSFAIIESFFWKINILVCLRGFHGINQHIFNIILGDNLYSIYLKNFLVFLPLLIFKEMSLPYTVCDRNIRHPYFFKNVKFYEAAKIEWWDNCNKPKPLIYIFFSKLFITCFIIFVSKNNF